MFELENIRVIDYLQLSKEWQEKYGELQKVMKPRPEFCGQKAKRLGTLEFGQVKKMQRDFANPTFDNVVIAFELIFGVSRHQLLRAWVTDFFYASNWLIAAITKISENEKKNLAAEPDANLEAAGVERLAAFRELSVLFDLGQRYGKEPKEIGKWTYNTVFAILAHDTVIGQVRKEYQRITTKSA